MPPNQLAFYADGGAVGYNVQMVQVLLEMGIAQTQGAQGISTNNHLSQPTQPTYA